jgi:hypothetical protein
MSSSLGTMSGGARANNTGNALESFVEDLLKRNSYTEFINYKKQIFPMHNVVGGNNIPNSHGAGNQSTNHHASVIS